MFARVVLQQCISARLQIRPATADSSAEFVQIREGLVVHTCFCRGATAETVAKLGIRRSALKFKYPKYFLLYLQPPKF
ncbi:hypothetical protein CAPTEDRAFT_145237 [Capitella teleta]|uniref:D-aminoacyl-tRNA deacylase n=1 Tax=Capitella teleta TaxID=283909 RepID=R7ULW1_CAPTE|nr:hypothetical protein CAPTEDRAFT_145237 [Capitella teleta]|eukprot:ELU07519.1 hypothetical protein CAPTEDRAFT_145237 [Capitella teleta]